MEKSAERDVSRTALADEEFAIITEFIFIRNNSFLLIKVAIIPLFTLSRERPPVVILLTLVVQQIPKSIPTTYFLDKNQQIFKVLQGEIDEDEIEEIIAKIN